VRRDGGGLCGWLLEDVVACLWRMWWLVLHVDFGEITVQQMGDAAFVLQGLGEWCSFVVDPLLKQYSRCRLRYLFAGLQMIASHLRRLHAIR
jgi:hypothetical protein